MWPRGMTSSTAMARATLLPFPDGAQVLVQLDGSKELLEGFLPAGGEHYDDFLNNSIQGISYRGQGVDGSELDVVLLPTL